MDRKLAAILTLTVGVLAAAPAWAAFENVMVSPRARAMGDAGVAVPDAAFASYLNPAGLAEQERQGSVGLAYVRPYGLDFHNLYYAGAAFRLPDGAGNLGVGFRQYAVEYQDVDLQTESTLTLAHGTYLYEDLHSSVALGYGVNFYRLEFGETVSGLDPGNEVTLGLDVGLVALLHDRTRVGLMIHNLNSPHIGEDEEEIPQRLHGGFSYEPYTGVITTVEAEAMPGDDTQWRGGLEMEVLPGFALRAGLMTHPNKLTAGFGYDSGPVVVNYGFSTGGGVLDTSHQFGLVVNWGGDAR